MQRLYIQIMHYVMYIVQCIIIISLADIHEEIMYFFLSSKLNVSFDFCD